MAIPFNQLNPIPFDPEFALFEHVARQLRKVCTTSAAAQVDT